MISFSWNPFYYASVSHNEVIFRMYRIKRIFLRINTWKLIFGETNLITKTSVYKSLKSNKQKNACQPGILTSVLWYLLQNFQPSLRTVNNVYLIHRTSSVYILYIHITNIMIQSLYCAVYVMLSFIFFSSAFDIMHFVIFTVTFNSIYFIIESWNN